LEFLLSNFQIDEYTMLESNHLVELIDYYSKSKPVNYEPLKHEYAKLYQKNFSYYSSQCTESNSLPKMIYSDILAINDNWNF
jgi:hypothetical protein